MKTRIPSTLAALALALFVAVPAADAGQLKPVGWGPLTSAQAAKKIKRSAFEPRPANRRANHRIPGRRQLAAWRARSELIYAKYVDGRFRGTTDEIILWAAIKWGCRPTSSDRWR